MYETPLAPPAGFSASNPSPALATQLGRPGTVTAAAIMWIIYGGLSLLGNLMSLAHPGGSAILGLGISILFLAGGIQLLSGKARGAVGLGVTSIVLGGIVLIACLALASMLHIAAGLLAILGLVFGGYLIVAGILGCSGNAKYKEWRINSGRY